MFVQRITVGIVAMALMIHALGASVVMATQPEPIDKYVRDACVRTPELRPGQPYPGRAAVVTSNKLSLPAGKVLYAAGEKVYLSGRVLDENCVPVSDAIVDIWQADTEGNIAKTSLGDRLKPEPHFTGSGRAVTDNLGRFNFVTVFPGSSSDGTPYINVRVVHSSFPELTTKMFFAYDRRNAGNKELASLPASSTERLMAQVWQRNPNKPELGLGMKWDIVLEGKNRTYKKF